MSNQPLQGIRIVDLTHVWAGPLATRMLGDLGADVVKVEAPAARGTTAVPPIGQGLWVGGEAGEDSWNRQSLFTKLNRSKRGVCIDLKTAAGKDTLLDLIRVADVVIENFSANAMDRLGLGYDILSDINPNILYISMPGFGSTGPYSTLTAFGPSVEPMTGLGALMGYSKAEPRNTAMALVDAIGGVSAASAVVTALNRRQHSKRGAHIELSLHEAGVSFFGDFLVDQQLGADHKPLGNAHPGYAPHGIYPTSGTDEWIAIACPCQESWTNLQRAAPDLWADLPPLNDPADRLANRIAIDQQLAGWTSAFNKHTLARQLQSAGVPAGAVNAAPDFMEDAHLLERGYWVDLALEGQTSVRYPGLPISLNGELPPHGSAAPKFGEHNREVLKDWVGRSNEDIASLTEAGVLLDRPPA